MFEPIIGLEVHLQPKTKSKMFCSCSADYFGKKPNTHTCPVCLGLPGALPVPNKAAIEKCIKLALALDCSINKESKFDRKNYFYPDLPKGYQISQYDLPIGYKGFIELDIDGDDKRIRINRVHMEEDTGKSLHKGQETLLDFNKSGMPLIEIVSEPDFTNVKEVEKFAKRLRQIVRYLDISDADMEKGQMRFELNMSLRHASDTKLPDYRVEIKNIGSISVLSKVINFEFNRQKQILEQGKIPVQETRGLRDLSGETYMQRVKEGSDDYRYFPEPDIPPMFFSEKMINDIRNTICELPGEKKAKYIKEYGLEPDSAEVIISSKERADWFEKAINGEKDKKVIIELSKLFIGDILALLKAEKKDIKELKFNKKDLLKISQMICNGKLSRNIAKQQVIPEIYKTGKATEAVIQEKGLLTISSSGELEKIAKKVIEVNPKVVEGIKKNPNAVKFLLGQIMRGTKGKADPRKAMAVLKDLLNL